jgi:L-glutamine-phosphate cytidylyltransferase
MGGAQEATTVNHLESSNGRRVPESPAVPAVILAAGLGRRIASRTNGGPKALLELNGRTLLERIVDALQRAGFHEVIVVTGHAAEQVRPYLATGRPGMILTERWNPEFATGNNIVSLLAAGDLVGDGFCLLNCDITFDPSILRELADLDAGNWMVVDGDEPLGAEEMKVVLDDRGVITRVSKGIDPATAAGEYIGISRFDAAGAAVLQATARRLVSAGARDLYYEDAIDTAAAELAVRAMWTRNRPWTEIDDEFDYERAVGVAAQLDAETETPR